MNTPARGTKPDLVQDEPPFEVIENNIARFLRVETEDGPDLFPYIGLRHVSSRVLSGPSDRNTRRREQIRMKFDEGVVIITGSGLFKMLDEIQQERLYAVRAGVPENPDHPHIEMVEIFEPGETIALLQPRK